MKRQKKAKICDGKLIFGIENFMTSMDEFLIIKIKLIA